MADTTDSNKKLLLVATVIIVFTCLAGLIVSLARAGIISISLAILMLIGLVGIYFGLGILVAVHLMVRKLE